MYVHMYIDIYMCVCTYVYMYLCKYKCVCKPAIRARRGMRKAIVLPLPVGLCKMVWTPVIITCVYVCMCNIVKTSM